MTQKAGAFETPETIRASLRSSGSPALWELQISRHVVFILLFLLPVRLIDFHNYGQESSCLHRASLVIKPFIIQLMHNM